MDDAKPPHTFKVEIFGFFDETKSAPPDDAEGNAHRFVLFALGPPKPFPYTALVGVSTPEHLFKNEEQAQEWIALTEGLFRTHAKTALLNALRMLLLDAGNLALMEQNITSVDKRSVLHNHLALSEKFARELFKLEVGRPPHWTSDELSQAISEAMYALLPRERNYDGVAGKLRDVYGERAPASGGALRQQVIRLGLNWKELKGEVAKRRKSVRASYDFNVGENVGNEVTFPTGEI
jgi:hypothetical protein